MLKITKHLENGKTVRLRLDGTISNEILGQLTEVFAIHRDRADQTIILDMAGVNFMNEQAARELVNMRSEHLTIVNCSPFIATLLETSSKGEIGE